MMGTRTRLAIVVSHPIQYYAPLYRMLAARDDVTARVFFTWHAGQSPVVDSGFKHEVAWDIPITDGYDWKLVANTSRCRGTDHFWGLRNPALNKMVDEWRPDVVHLTGYNYASHLSLMRHLWRRGTPVVFRGHSHLLTPRPWWKQAVRNLVLNQIYRWPAGFLFVGKHNYDYYRALGVPESKLFYCPHSIDVARFTGDAEHQEADANKWRHELGIDDDQVVVLFAGKLQQKKQPLALIEAMAAARPENSVLVIVGDGELRDQVAKRATAMNVPHRLLPFQNQSRMPVVYRLGDVFALPSIADETWGLAVNEAMACSRPVLVSDQVGCAPDLIVNGKTGKVFPANSARELAAFISQFTSLGRPTLLAMGRAAASQAAKFDIPITCERLMAAIDCLLKRGSAQMALHELP